MQYFLQKWELLSRSLSKFWYPKTILFIKPSDFDKSITELCFLLYIDFKQQQEYYWFVLPSIIFFHFSQTPFFPSNDVFCSIFLFLLVQTRDGWPRCNSYCFVINKYLRKFKVPGVVICHRVCGKCLCSALTGDWSCTESQLKLNIELHNTAFLFGKQSDHALCTPQDEITV